MKIDEKVYWDVYRSVGAEVSRGNNGGVGSEVGGEFLSGDGEGVEL